MSHDSQAASTSYDGLPIRCAPGAHEAAAELLTRHAGPRAGVLDVAAGSGALLARLRDAGYSDLNAIELDVGKFQMPGVTPMPLDLNGDFAAGVGRTFSVITAVEIIEHLDCPRHFLRQLRALLADDGWLLLSTPNVSHWIGRIKFLLRGDLRNFDEAQYEHNHHISPIPHTQMRHMLAEVGLQTVAAATAGTFFSRRRQRVLAPGRWLFRWLDGPATDGDVRLYLCQRAAPRVRRPGDWTDAPPPPPPAGPVPARGE